MSEILKMEQSVTNALGAVAAKASVNVLTSKQFLWHFGGFAFVDNRDFLESTNILYSMAIGSNEYTRVTGRKGLKLEADWGEQKVPSDSVVPGGQQKAMTARTSDGRLWLFGGDSHTEEDQNFIAGSAVLSVFDPLTKKHTFVSGSKEIQAPGKYGDFQVASPLNHPGARQSGAMWSHIHPTFGEVIYIHGGFGFGESKTLGTGRLGDTWIYIIDADSWVHIHGSKKVNDNSSNSWGTKLVSSPTNSPSPRNFMAVFSDGARMFFHGGSGEDSVATSGRLGDVWAFDPLAGILFGEWMWTAGPNLANQNSVNFSPGVPHASNEMGGRIRHSAAYNFAINKTAIGYGEGFNTSGFDSFNGDIWLYDHSSDNLFHYAGDETTGSKATVLGAFGAPDPLTIPGGRIGCCMWVDNFGYFAVGLGNGIDTDATLGLLSDFYFLTPISGLFLDFSITALADKPSIVVDDTGFDPGNRPPARAFSAYWPQSNSDGQLYFLGGQGYFSDNTGAFNEANDLWRIDGAASVNWAVDSGTYSVLHPEDSGTPGSPSGRNGAAVWEVNGVVYCFGGFGNSDTLLGNEYLQSMFKLDTNAASPKWERLNSITGPNGAGVYGGGTFDAANIPGARAFGVAFVNPLNADELILFGGEGYDSAPSLGFLADVLVYSISLGHWKHQAGPTTVNPAAVYGTKGTQAAGNNPPGLRNARGAIDSSGKMFLMGGVNNGGNDFHNTFWELDPANFRYTWVAGDNTPNPSAILDTSKKGQFLDDTITKPGGKEPGGYWIDSQDIHWIWGGRGIDAEGNSFVRLNDMVAFDRTSGKFAFYTGGRLGDSNVSSYGIKGQPGSDVTPGDAQNCSTWQGKDGLLYLGFGHGFAKTPGVDGLLNHLFAFDPVTLKQWKWVTGSNDISVFLGALASLEFPPVIPGGVRDASSFMTSNFAPGDKITVNGVDFVAGTDFEIGDDERETAANIVEAVNASADVAIDEILTASINLNDLSEVNLEADEEGTSGNELTLSAVDSGLQNFELSGSLFIGGSGGEVDQFVLERGADNLLRGYINDELKFKVKYYEPDFTNETAFKTDFAKFLKNAMG